MKITLKDVVTQAPTGQARNLNVFFFFWRVYLKTFFARGREDEGAQALPEEENDGADLRRSVASLVDAMRDLLNNIRPEIPNDADAEENENDDSPDDDLT